MIAALRTILATVLVALACAFATTPAATPAATAAPAAADCEPLDLDNPTAVREAAAAVTDVFAGKVREVEPRTAVGGGEGKANQDQTTDGPTDAPPTGPPTGRPSRPIPGPPAGSTP